MAVALQLMLTLAAKLTTHIINLKRSPQRWDFVSTHLSSHGINAIRIEAVDGKELVESEISKKYSATYNKSNYFWPLKPSEIGCYMSHRQSMQTFVDNAEADYLLLLEDDTETDHRFSDHIESWLNIVNKPYPVSLKLFTKRSINGPVVAAIAGINIIRPHRIPLGCPAQLLNKPAARKLLEFSTPFYRPIDVDYQLWWKHGVDVLCTESSLFKEVSQQLGGTNIGGSGDLSMWDKIKRELGRSWFRIKLSVFSYLHRLANTQSKG